MTLLSFDSSPEQKIAELVGEVLRPLLKFLSILHIIFRGGHDEASVDHGVRVLQLVDILDLVDFGDFCSVKIIDCAV